MPTVTDFGKLRKHYTTLHDTTPHNTTQHYTTIHYDTLLHTNTTPHVHTHDKLVVKRSEGIGDIVSGMMNKKIPMVRGVVA